MKLLVVSLGCDKNLSDTEYIMGLCEKEGYSFTDETEEADIIIVNTCCFIGDAKEESVNTLLEMAEYKTEKGGNCKALIACGCLAQRYADEIRREIPEVDAVIGTNSYDAVTEAINNALSNRPDIYIKPLEGLPEVNAKRILTTGGHYAYLKIAEGCNKNCTYCIIPKLRGRYRSVPMEKLIDEAKSLADGGVRELIIVAQETTLYGVDLYNEKKLPELLNKLSEIDGIEWIRLLYAYPEEITDELVDVIASNEKVCKYIDMPIQHGSDNVLYKMGRRTRRAEITEVIEKIRKKIPDITIRTTLISGFPGETEEDHREMLDFVNTIKFDRLGVFTYSREEDTVAYSMENQVDEEIMNRRKEEIMLSQQDIVFAKNESLIGATVDVFIEGKLVEEDVYAGRTSMDAPNVDGMIFVSADRELMSGDIVKCVVTDAYEYDLIGEIIED